MPKRSCVSLQHAALGGHFGLPHGSRRLDVHDHRMIKVDQIVGGVGVEGRLARSRSPARGRIGEVDPLGRHRRCAAKGCIVEHVEILAHGAACCFGRQAVFAGHRSLAIYIGTDLARIDREALGAHQSFGHAALDRHLEQLAQQITVAEPAVPVLGEGGVVGHRALEIEAAKPAIGEVQVHLLAQPPLRSTNRSIDPSRWSAGT